MARYTAERRAAQSRRPRPLLSRPLSSIRFYGREAVMPRQKSLATVIRDLVQEEVGDAIRSLLGSASGTKPKAKNGRRRRRRKTRGKWRPGGPGRPPKAVAEKMAHRKAVTTPVAPKPKTVRRRRRRRRGPGRQAGSKKKVA